MKQHPIVIALLLIPASLLLVYCLSREEKSASPPQSIPFKKWHLPKIIGGYEWVGTNKIFYVGYLHRRFAASVANPFAGDHFDLEYMSPYLTNGIGVDWKMLSESILIVSVVNHERKTYAVDILKSDVTELEALSPMLCFLDSSGRPLCLEKKGKAGYNPKFLKGGSLDYFESAGLPLGISSGNEVVLLEVADGLGPPPTLKFVSLSNGNRRTIQLAFDGFLIDEAVMSADRSKILCTCSKRDQTGKLMRGTKMWLVDLSTGQHSVIYERNDNVRVYWTRFCKTGITFVEEGFLHFFPMD